MDAKAQTNRLIRNPKDFYGGMALMALAVVAWWGSFDLSSLQGTHFGAGTAPRLYAALLFLVGGVIAASGLVRDGHPIERYGMRGPLLIAASMVLFATTIDKFGLPITSFLAILVASTASRETRWLESVLWAAFLAATCTLLFVFALGLPLPLWPDF